jgi:hypothetical protein
MFLFLTAMACSSNAESPAEPLSESSPKAVATPTATASTSTSALPDLKAGLSREGCDNGPGVMGAASYFVGEITLAENNASGSEEWVLFANQKWAASNGKDCTVRWSLHGSKTSTQACGRCDFGVSLTNTMDVTGSDCPEDMAKGETGQQINYDIDLKDDGTVDVFFARSGKRVGEGYHNNGVIRYATDMSCRWF